MSATGPERDELERLLRDMGPEPLLQEADALGLGRVGRRVRCPFAGCQDQGPKRNRNAVVFGSHPRVHCHRCGTRGDLVDVLQLSRGWSLQQVLEYVRGRPSPPLTPRRSPQLRVVPPAEDPDKLSPSEVHRLWEKMALKDELGWRYLEGRHLEGAVELGLVRFCTGEHPDQKLRKWASKMGLRVAALMMDVVGEPRGVQLRRVNGEEPSKLFAEGSDPRRGFFGHPDRIDAAPVVAVAEGLADTLALALWAHKDTAVEVVGAAGAGNLAGLADELAAAGVPLEGKVFALFVQNDRKARRRADQRLSPMNPSRVQFTRLAQKLKQLGAGVAFVPTPELHKDVAAWRAAEGLAAEWPPDALRGALVPEPGGGAEAEERSAIPEGHAFPLPAQVRADVFAQNYTTLVAILDDPVYREPILGRGELEWCQMRGAILFGGRPVLDADVSTVRLGLEQHSRSTDGKPLQFGREDIWAALHQLAQRRQVHPVRDWLKSLEWDGVERLGVDLPALFGYGPEAIEAILLRRWFLGAAVRALQPGCKMESALILVGPQGWGKTLFFDTIGGEFYTSEPVTIGDKDGKQVIGRAWIIEWGELLSLRRVADFEAVKDFLSLRVDLYRAPYGRIPVPAPRTCAFGGTTNNPDYLADPTGNRRFWTVELRRRIDVAWVRAARSLLWAEAVAVHRSASTCAACAPLSPEDRCWRHRWWLDVEEQEALSTLNERHEVQHPWTDLIRDWLRQHPAFESVTAAQLLVDALKMPVHQLGGAGDVQVGKVMKALRWRRRRRRLEDGLYHWVYVSPGSQEEAGIP